MPGSKQNGESARVPTAEPGPTSYDIDIMWVALIGAIASLFGL